MTDYYDAAPEDVEELCIAWLAPLGAVGFTRESGDALPFRLVQHITGDEDLDRELAAPVVSVHTLCAKDNGSPTAWLAFLAECALTHNRMKELNRLPTITLTDGRLASVDYLDIFEAPVWTPYQDDQILRKTGRYQIGMSYVPAAVGS